MFSDEDGASTSGSGQSPSELEPVRRRTMPRDSGETGRGGREGRAPAVGAPA